MTGKTKSGFDFNVPADVLDSMELIDAICEADENQLAVSKLITLLLGGEQKKRLYDHLRTEDGRVPVVACVNAVREIFEALGGTGKKS